MSYKITITNPGNHICNPLLTLDGRQYATREDACEAINEALYDVIDSEPGCEMVERPDACNGDDDEAANAALVHYIADCHAFILSRGYATEDGVSACVEEVTEELGHLWHCTREGITGDVMDNGPAYTREEAAGFTGIELGADDECVHLREETGADDVTSDVDFVAVDGDGNVLGYYRFKPVRIED